MRTEQSMAESASSLVSNQIVLELSKRFYVNTPKEYDPKRREWIARNVARWNLDNENDTLLSYARKLGSQAYRVLRGYDGAVNLIDRHGNVSHLGEGAIMDGPRGI